jgi:hypothetical protein
MSSAAPPTRIGPYEIVSRLGAGGMAETYVAVRRGPGAFAQRVCLKRLRPELERDPEFVRQFMAEAAIAAQLRHAAIAQVLDFGQAGADYYLALELVEGCDLRELLLATGGKLSPALVAYIASELATALDIAHRTGAGSRAAVVHRDVSPSNTLVSTAGEVKLTDFGIARALGGARFTETGIVKGKVPYMAPEYARHGKIDPRGDLFSLGVLLYECACGERPHDGATELETLERASRGQRRPLAERAPELPAGLAEIIECLLEPDPELRYQSASGLLEALLSQPAPARARLDLGALVGGAVRARGLAASDPALASADTELIDAPGSRGGAAAAREHSPGGSATRASGSTAIAPLTGAAEAAVEPGRARVRVGRRALFVLGAALLFASSVLAFALVRGSDVSGAEPAPRTAAVEASSAESLPANVAAGLGNRAPQPPDSPTGAEARAGSGSAGTQGARERAASAQADTSALAGTARSGQAWLEVIVVPYGDVAVDGRPVGAAPVTVAVGPGEHVVETHSRGETLRRKVTLTPGQRRQVVLK